MIVLCHNVLILDWTNIFKRDYKRALYGEHLRPSFTFRVGIEADFPMSHLG